MKVNDIRHSFLNFFQSKGHQIVTSSPVVPGDDPTLLFTNAGMNQFKEVFLGLEKRPYIRATSAQKCVRAGGKHNDLDNVGYTARHHTFFEMLGNFSFGDYFKKEAIHFAWEFLTQTLQLPPEKLWVTVYAQDDEAYAIWTQQIGVSAARVIKIGDNKGARYASDNFWMMGDTGPCGPCTEIFYDHGPEIPGGPPGSPEEDGDRYIEIWNNVFMQFNRDEAGVMHPLPKPSVDTGMGLERISAVMQHVHSNYEIDLFVNLLAAAKQSIVKASVPETLVSQIDGNTPSLRVIADHIRASSFIVADGVIPGNAGRGYVLRRITRRAIRHGYKLGAREPFFYELVSALAREMGEAYPEIKNHQDRIMGVLKQEEERFFQTIANGMEILENSLNEIDASQTKVLNGEIAFKLHDTFGFPLDLTADVCRERNVLVDVVAFDKAMNHQREQARAAGKFKISQGFEYSGAVTQFEGYENSVVEKIKITGLFQDDVSLTQISAGEHAVVIVDKSPFYAESGGQVGDRGELRNTQALFAVEDTVKVQPEVFGHHGQLLEGKLSVGDVLTAKVNMTYRQHVMRNHSATHLMHKALRETLGSHVQQKGSLVDADKTRFDFTHNAPVTKEQIEAVELFVNQEVLKNHGTSAQVMSLEEAQKTGAMMLFGEKYGEVVRVLEIGSSKELCGGTHVTRTGDIGFFKIVAESGVAAGIRRIEAITGENSLKHLQKMNQQTLQTAQLLKAHPEDIIQRLVMQQEHLKGLEKELERLNSKMAASQSDELLSQTKTIKNISVLVTITQATDVKILRETLDQIKNKIKSGIILLAAVNDGKVQLIAGITTDLTSKIKAGDLVNYVALQVGGKGGGKPDLAMAGGTDAASLPRALESVAEWLEKRL